jgi:hypothetical protein
MIFVVKNKMKKKYFSITAPTIVLFLTFAGCNGNKSEVKTSKEPEVVKTAVVNKPVVVGTETSLLLEDDKGINCS